MARSVMPTQERFASVPPADVRRSTFDRSHGHKTTFDAGYLIPILIDEILPGDTVNLRTSTFARLATPLAPIMDNMFLETFFFFVPNRLLWVNWEKFNGAQDDPGDTTAYNIPRLADGATVSEGSLHDYFGLPLAVTSTNERINALPFRAYRLIWNEWFRDENLQDTLNVDTTDGPDGAGYGLSRRGKRHDYFTSCLPWPQKDTLATVSLPLGTSAEVHAQGSAGTVVSVYADGHSGYRQLIADTVSLDEVDISTVVGTSANVLYADLSTATAASINEIRQAFQLQRLAERDARGGTRYIEIIRSHFGVVSPDARLQRPEYLGGGSARVNISPVPNTSATATEDQGHLTGYGTVSANGHGFVRSFTEHGYIIGLTSVRADLTYQQGLDRFWSRVTREDYYWPALATIGEQTVLQKEIFIANTAADDNVFGYQERYAEYRYKPSRISGLFRSDATGTLEHWHLATDFSVAPTLNSTFIEDNPPIDRVIATPTEPHFIADFYFKMRHARPMPVYGVPGLIDHF